MISKKAIFKKVIKQLYLSIFAWFLLAAGWFAELIVLVVQFSKMTVKSPVPIMFMIIAVVAQLSSEIHIFTYLSIIKDLNEYMEED